jgi:hypothetical protein
VATYSIHEWKLSLEQIAAKFTDGIADLSPEGADLEMSIGISLTIPDELAELMEEAAKRGGIEMVRAEGRWVHDDDE